MSFVRILRVLALAGLFISSYLLVLKLTGRISYLVGCGEGSGCANVLGSRWSQFFYLPVTAFSAGMYALLFLATWRPSRTLCAGLAICFGGAAFWFYGVLLFDLKAFCPWCVTAHLIGLTSAVLLACNLRGESKLSGGMGFGALGGMLALSVLVLGQLFGPVPQTHTVSTETVEPEDSKIAVHARGKGRTVIRLGGSKLYNTTTLPHLGPADAPQVLVKYFDYTCDSCLQMDEVLKRTMEKHPGRYCVIVLPVPLNRSCNAYYPIGFDDHAHACEMSRLALAAWRANPDVFAQVHELLFTRPVLDPEIVEIGVSAIVGQDKMDKALQDFWVQEVLSANVNDFRQLTAETVKMPKLLIGESQVLHGLPASQTALIEALEEARK